MRISLLVFLGIALAAISCARVRTATSADGVPIAFEVHGSGQPALVFVHGWTNNRSIWDVQVPHFAQQHKVVTLDLAGHGESGRDRLAWTMAAFGEDVVAVVDKLGLDQVVLIGFSMGGPAILEAARRMPNRVVGLVGVDTFKDVETKMTQEQIDEFLAPFRANFEEALGNFARGALFLPTADSAYVEKILAQVGEPAPAEVGIPALEAALKHDLPTALQEAPVPIRCINSDLTPTNIEAGQRHASSFEVVQMSGVGHVLFLEEPETFNRLLAEIVAELVALAEDR